MQRGKDFPFSYGAQGLGVHIKQESTNYMRCGKKLVNGIKKDYLEINYKTSHRLLFLFQQLTTSLCS